jgi:hypothetical protein
MPLPAQPDAADLCADAILSARKAKGPLFRDDIAAVCRPIIGAAVEEAVSDASPKAKKAREATAHTIPPDAVWVTLYSAEIEYPMDGQKWCDTYAQKGWVVSGKAKMKDWKAAVRNWKANEWGQESRIALKKTRSASRNDTRYTEPKGDWRATAKQIFNLETLPEKWATWFDVPTEYREQIAKAHPPTPKTP